MIHQAISLGMCGIPGIIIISHEKALSCFIFITESFCGLFCGLKEST